MLLNFLMNQRTVCEQEYLISTFISVYHFEFGYFVSFEFFFNTPLKLFHTGRHAKSLQSIVLFISRLKQ